jgi:hypothetical protein
MPLHTKQVSMDEFILRSSHLSMSRSGKEVPVILLGYISQEAPPEGGGEFL